MDEQFRQRPGSKESDLDLTLAEDEPENNPSGGSNSVKLFNQDIRKTTQIFNTKIQQKKREQEKKLDEADKLNRLRQSYITQSMVGMRKSLREVTRLDLGRRFSFVVTTDDWQGWPRVTLSIQDVAQDEAPFPHFQIVGGYRAGKAQIDIDLGDAENIMTFTLTSEGDLKKLSASFNKSVRSYLDMIGDVILQAERAPIEKPLEHTADSEEENTFAADLLGLSEDIFEEYPQDDNLFEALPNIESLDALPGWGPSAGNNPKVRR